MDESTYLGMEKVGKLLGAVLNIAIGIAAEAQPMVGCNYEAKI